MRSSIGIRVPATALPVEPEEGPARKRLQGPNMLLWLVPIIVLGCAIAWWLGGR